MELLPNEQFSKDFVERIGIERADRILTLLTKRIERRINIANQNTFGQFFDNTCIFRADWEVTLEFHLKMGVQLLNTDTPAKARERIIARRLARRNSMLRQKSQRDTFPTAC